MRVPLSLLALRAVVGQAPPPAAAPGFFQPPTPPTLPTLPTPPTPQGEGVWGVSAYLRAAYSSADLFYAGYEIELTHAFQRFTATLYDWRTATHSRNTVGAEDTSPPGDRAIPWSVIILWDRIEELVITLESLHRAPKPAPQRVVLLKTTHPEDIVQVVLLEALCDKIFSLHCDMGFAFSTHLTFTQRLALAVRRANTPHTQTIYASNNDTPADSIPPTSPSSPASPSAPASPSSPPGGTGVLPAYLVVASPGLFLNTEAIENLVAQNANSTTVNPVALPGEATQTTPVQKAPLQTQNPIVFRKKRQLYHAIDAWLAGTNNLANNLGNNNNNNGLSTVAAAADSASAVDASNSDASVSTPASAANASLSTPSTAVSVPALATAAAAAPGKFAFDAAGEHTRVLELAKLSCMGAADEVGCTQGRIIESEPYLFFGSTKAFDNFNINDVPVISDLGAEKLAAKVFINDRIRAVLGGNLKELPKLEFEQLRQRLIL